MKVYCYFQETDGRSEWLETIDLWKASWSRQGWEPIVLGISEARIHPLFAQTKDNVKLLPTINGEGFNSSSYLRHLAFASVEGLCVDFDIMNRSFTPPQIEPLIKENPEIFSLCQDTVAPCCLWATQHAREAIVRMIAWWNPEKFIISHTGKPHCSDMTIFGNFRVKSFPIALLDRTPGSDTAALIHFPGRPGPPNKPERIRRAGFTK